MTIHDRRRTHPVTAHAYMLPIVREVPVHAHSAAERPAQRELVAWSLLTCPDRATSDSR